MRARGDAVRGREAAVDRVHLAEFHHDRPPGGEGGGVVKHHVVVLAAVYGQHERVEGHVLDDLERADAEVLFLLLHRGAQVVDPVADMVQGIHHRFCSRSCSRPWSAPPPNWRSWSMVIPMNG